MDRNESVQANCVGNTIPRFNTFRARTGNSSSSTTRSPSARRLPVLGVLEAERRIRVFEGGLQVNIMPVTASAFTSRREEAFAAGFHHFLQQPYRAAEIFDCTARYPDLRYVYRWALRGAVTDLPVTPRPEDLLEGCREIAEAGAS
jgi:CheY-like chemotaxis protein